MTGGIFISYRRLDSKSEARSICQRLEKTFAKRRVFIDVDSIRPGENFQSVLKSDLEKCSAMVVVIGPRWLELLRSVPANRDTSDDYVQLEVASALERQLPIFPVLVDGATMPDPKDLPDGLKPLAFRQAFSVRHDSFPRDMWELEQELRRTVPTPRTWTAALIAGLLIVAAGAISYYLWRSWSAPADVYARSGNFACFGDAEFPDDWREEASFCLPIGCNFGKLSRDACLALGARKGSKTVIHGNVDSSRANECWLQHSCGKLQPHGEFTMFMSAAKTYSNEGSYECRSNAEYPASWRGEASWCTPGMGCNFGKLSQDACLALGAKKGSKTVLHGNTGTAQANECWMRADSCEDTKPSGSYTLFQR
jgi:hypothetical protein